MEIRKTEIEVITELIVKIIISRLSGIYNDALPYADNE